MIRRWLAPGLLTMRFITEQHLLLLQLLALRNLNRRCGETLPSSCAPNIPTCPTRLMAAAKAGVLRRWLYRESRGSRTYCYLPSDRRFWGKLCRLRDLRLRNVKYAACNLYLSHLSGLHIFTKIQPNQLQVAHHFFHCQLHREHHHLQLGKKPPCAPE